MTDMSKYLVGSVAVMAVLLMIFSAIPATASDDAVGTEDMEFYDDTPDVTDKEEYSWEKASLTLTIKKDIEWKDLKIQTLTDSKITVKVDAKLTVKSFLFMTTGGDVLITGEGKIVSMGFVGRTLGATEATATFDGLSLIECNLFEIKCEGTACFNVVIQNCKDVEIKVDGNEYKIEIPKAISTDGRLQIKDSYVRIDIKNTLPPCTIIDAIKGIDASEPKTNGQFRFSDVDGETVGWGDKVSRVQSSNAEGVFEIGSSPKGQDFTMLIIGIVIAVIVILALVALWYFKFRPQAAQQPAQEQPPTQ